MIEALLDAFGNGIEHCISETFDILIEVFDCYVCTPAQQRSYIKTEPDQPIHFTLNNPLAANLVFIALDNCTLQAHDPSRCDFLIGNFQKLYFVEIKRVNLRQRKAAREDAINQLHSSISLLRGRINLQRTNLIAVICLKAKQVYPLQTAKRIADVVAFKDNYNADLMEGQSHTF